MTKSHTLPLIVIATLATACGPSSGDSSVAPTVRSNTPLDSAIFVAINGNASATFSEAMDPASLTASTFELIAGATAVLGTVIYADSTAVLMSLSSCDSEV